MHQSKSLMYTILFASLIVTTALVFNGYAYLQADEGGPDQTNLQAEIEKGIQAYIQKQQDEYKKAQEEADKPKTVSGDFKDDDAVLGSATAPVTLVEFSDYECPFCKRHFTQTFPQIKAKYIDTGKVKFIFRDFPLSFHEPLATQEAIAAECAREQGGDKIYYSYHDLLYKNTTSNGNGLTKEKLYDFAKELGLKPDKFKTCLDSEKYKDEVQKDFEDGGKAGITGTPAFIVGDQLISGAVPFSAFEKVIEEQLAKK